MQQLGGHVNRLAGYQGNIAVLHVENHLALEHLHEDGVHTVVLVPGLACSQFHEGQVAAVGIDDLAGLGLIFKGCQRFGELGEYEDAAFMGTCHGTHLSLQG